MNPDDLKRAAYLLETMAFRTDDSKALAARLRAAAERAGEAVATIAFVSYASTASPMRLVDWHVPTPPVGTKLYISPPAWAMEDALACAEACLAVGKSMTVGERFSNAGQSLIDAMPSAHRIKQGASAKGAK